MFFVNADLNIMNSTQFSPYYINISGSYNNICSALSLLEVLADSEADNAQPNNPTFLFIPDPLFI